MSSQVAIRHAKRIKEAVSAGDLRIVHEEIGFLLSHLGNIPESPEGFELVLQDRFELAEPSEGNNREEAQKVSRFLSALDLALLRRRYTYCATGIEVCIALLLVREVWLTYASMGHTLAEYCREHAMRMALVHAADGTATVALPRPASGRAILICAPVTMRIEKLLVAVAKYLGRVHRHSTVKDFDTLENALVREIPVRIWQVPILVVSLEVMFTEKEMYIAFLRALDGVAGSTLAQEDKDHRYNWNVLAQHLLNANVGLVAIHGLCRVHRLCPVAQLWDRLLYLQRLGLSIGVCTTSAIEDLPRDGAYRQLFIERPWQVGSLDLACSEKTARHYWDRLKTGRSMPSNLPWLVEELLGQREWIDLAMDKLIERVVGLEEDPEAAVKAAVGEVLADVGELHDRLLKSMTGEEISLEEQKKWRDYLVLPITGAAK